MAAAELILKIIGQDSSSGAINSAKAQIDGLDGAAGKATTSTGGLGTKLSGVASIAGGFVVGSALTNLPGLLMDGARGAAEDEAAMGRLEQAVENTGSAYGDFDGAIRDAISSGQDLAFTDGEVADALGTLVSLTGSTEEGMGRLTAAQDLARGANISLEQAAKLLGKTSDENTSALGRLGIALGEGATATDVLAAVQEKFGGQAQQYAQSAAGEYDKFNQQMGELQETVGSALIPIFMELAPVILQVVEAALPLVDAIAPLLSLAAAGLAPVIGLIAGAIAELTSHTPGMIALGLALALAFLPVTGAALGVLAVVAAVGALVAVGYTFRDEIMGAFNTVFNFISENWPLLVSILGGPIGAAVVQIIEHWDEIQAIFQAGWDFVSGLLTGSWETVTSLLQMPIDAGRDAVDAAWQAIQGLFQAGWDFVSGLLSGSWSTVQSLLQMPVDAGKAAIDLIWQAITGYFNFHIGVITGVLGGAWAAIQWLLSNPVQWASDTISGILSTVVGFFTALPGQITSALSSFGTLLIQHGRDLVDGLFDGVKEIWAALLNWLGMMGGRILSGVGNIGGILYDIGRQIIQGLWDGMLSVWGDVTGWLGGIGGTIADLKGPIEKDRQLLVPQGMAIMEGLADGMQRGFVEFVMPVLWNVSAAAGAWFKAGPGAGPFAFADGVRAGGYAAGVAVAPNFGYVGGPNSGGRAPINAGGRNPMDPANGGGRFPINAGGRFPINSGGRHPDPVVQAILDSFEAPGRLPSYERDITINLVVDSQILATVTNKVNARDARLSGLLRSVSG